MINKLKDLTMSDEFFDNFSWHSAVPLDSSIKYKNNKVSSIENTKFARSKFIASGDSLLIHKAKQALWKISEDGSQIEAVFESDVLEPEDFK